MCLPMASSTGPILGGCSSMMSLSLSTIDVELGDVDERVAVGARHLGVDLGDDRLRDLRRGLGVVDRDAERAEPVLVRRRDLDEHHVGRQVALAEQLGDLVEEDRDVVAAAVLDGLARGGADEQRLVVEAVGVLGPAVLALAHGDHVVDLDVLELARARHERVDQLERLAAGVREHHAVAGLDALERPRPPWCAWRRSPSSSPSPYSLSLRVTAGARSCDGVGTPSTSSPATTTTGGVRAGGGALRARSGLPSAALRDELMIRGARPRTAAEVHGRPRGYVRVVDGQAGGDGGAVDVRVTAPAVHDLHARLRRRALVGHVQYCLTAVGVLTLVLSHGLPTSAMALASSFLWSRLDWRAIMMRCACGEPAPCMDSVR